MTWGFCVQQQFCRNWNVSPIQSYFSELERHGNTTKLAGGPLCQGLSVITQHMAGPCAFQNRKAHLMETQHLLQRLKTKTEEGLHLSLIPVFLDCVGAKCGLNVHSFFSTKSEHFTVFVIFIPSRKCFCIWPNVPICSDLL